MANRAVGIGAEGMVLLLRHGRGKGEERAGND
jgi:hypothetical protein